MVQGDHILAYFKLLTRLPTTTGKNLGLIVSTQKISPTEDELEQCTLTWVYATAEISVTGHELNRFWLY
jgi:hypothetical protein